MSAVKGVLSNSLRWATFLALNQDGHAPIFRSF
jgi:hypothetical protein